MFCTMFEHFTSNYNIHFFLHQIILFKSQMEYLTIFVFLQYYIYLIFLVLNHLANCIFMDDTNTLIISAPRQDLWVFLRDYLQIG